MVYNLGTNSEKIFLIKKTLFLMVSQFHIGIINFAKIFTIVLVEFSLKWLNLEKIP